MQANGELSRAAAALLVKTVRVGVGLGELLALHLKKQCQTVITIQGNQRPEITLPEHKAKPKRATRLLLQSLEKTKVAKLPNPE